MKTQITRAPSRRRRRRQRRWPLFLLLAAALVIAVGFSHLGSGQMRHLKSVSLPDWVDVQIIPVNGAARPGRAHEEGHRHRHPLRGQPRHHRPGQPELLRPAGHPGKRPLPGGLDGEVIQCIPLEEKSSATNERNRDTISIEVCHPDASGQFTQASYDTLVRLTAWLCDTAGIGRDRVIRHYDVTGKACPLFFVEHPDTWTQFLADVAAA